MSTPMVIGLGARRAWGALVAGIVVLGVLEAAVVHFVGRAVLPGTVALVVDVVAGVLTLGVVVAFASPLWGSVRSQAGVVRVRFGWLAAVDVPIGRIEAVREYRADVRKPAELGLDFDTESGILSIIRSPGSPLVMIELREAVPARTQGWRQVWAQAMLISVADPGELIDVVGDAKRRADNG